MFIAGLRNRTENRRKKSLFWSKRKLELNRKKVSFGMQQCRSSTHRAGASQKLPSKSKHVYDVKPFSPVLENYLNRRFEWKVDGCSKLVSPDKGDKAEKTYYRRSPSFRFMNRTWYLHLYPNLPSMVVCLMLSGEVSGPPVRLHHKFGLMYADGEIEWKFEAIGNFGSGTQNVWKKKGLTFLDKEELTKKASDLVTHDSITIVCTLCTEECARFVRDFMLDAEEYERIEKTRDIEDDTLYEVKGFPFFANVDLIRPHCPLLASQFDTGSIHKVDFPGIFVVMLMRYMEYGMVFKISVKELLRLYKLAVAYQIVGLRERCLASVTACLEPEDVLKVMDFAKTHSEPELLQVATKFLVSHAQQVVATKEWMLLVKKDPEQANQLYRRIACRITAAVS